MRVAIERNLQVRGREREVRSREAGISVAQRGDEARVDITGSAYRIAPTRDVPLPGGSRLRFIPPYVEQVNLTARKPLFDGGNTRINKEIAKAERDIAEYEMRALEGEIALRTEERAWEALKQHNLVQVALFAVTAAAEHVRVATERMQGGMVPLLDVLSAEAEVARAETVVIEAQTQARIAELYLKELLDIPLDAELQLQPGQESSFPSLPPEDLVRIALAGRPEVGQAKKEARRAGVETFVPFADQFPDVGVFVDLQQRTRVTSFPSRSVSVGVQGTWNVFDGGVRQAKRAQLNEKLRNAKLQAEAIAKKVAREAAEAYALAMARKQQIETARKQEARAAEHARLVALRYEEGLNVGQDVIDAAGMLTEAQSAVVRAQYDHALALTRLTLATSLYGYSFEEELNWGPLHRCYVFASKLLNRARAYAWRRQGGRTQVTLTPDQLRVSYLDEHAADRRLTGPRTTIVLTEEPLLLEADGATGGQLKKVLGAVELQATPATVLSSRPD